MEWNPMKDDYKSTQFNTYSSGPGANLDAAYQAPRLGPAGGVGGNNPLPYLVFKYVPKGMTKHALANLCSHYGRALNVRDSNRNDYFFADFANVAEMDAVHNGFQNNSYGIQVLFGKSRSKPENSLPPPLSNDTADDDEHQRNARSVRRKPVDVDNRKYPVSSKQLPRPHISGKSIVNAKNYADKRNFLQKNDPERHFLIQEDAHELERAKLAQPDVNNAQNNTKYKYRTGRAYIPMPNKTTQYIEEKHRQSEGAFNRGTNKYQNKEPIKQEKGKCAECQRTSDVVCSRCLTFYCGLECQRKAWPKHRYVCGKPANMQLKPPAQKADRVNDKENHFKTPTKSPHTKNIKDTPSPSFALTNMPTKVNYEAKMPRSGNLVTLTAISKSNLVFIRSKAHQDNMLFFDTITTIQAQAQNLRKITTPPTSGQIVIAQFEEQFNRAMILNANDLNCIRIIYIDYGNIHSKTMNELYEAPECYVQLPRLAKPVVLKHVPSAYLTENVRQFMYTYLEGIDLIVKYNEKEDFIGDKGVYCVELIDAISNQNFNKTVAALCTPVEPKSADEAFFRQYLKQQPITAGDNIELIVMDNSLLSTGCISCTTKEYALEIQKFQKELQRYAESLEEQCYAPRVDELCIAKYDVDKKWYRGRCLDLVGDGFPTIVFFDYGNVAYINIKDIRRYPAAFTYPIFTADCEIEGLPEYCDAQIVAKLEELIPNGSVIKCEHIKKYDDEDNFLTLTLPKVTEQLNAADFLKLNEDK